MVAKPWIQEKPPIPAQVCRGPNAKEAADPGRSGIAPVKESSSECDKT